MDNKKIIKFFKYFLLTCFITFVSLYISQSTGYFEYKNSKKVSLTNAQIKQFEEDVNSGKNVDLKKYTSVNNKDYNNKLSKAGLSFSETTSKFIQKAIDKTFKVLSKFVGE